MKGLQEFFDSYVETALWSSTDEDGESLDIYDSSDIDQRSLDSMMKDAESFLEANKKDIGSKYSRAGHDFFLTRNKHGAGFWDGDWAEPAATRLTKESHAYGPSDLYLGDDGKIHVT